MSTYEYYNNEFLVLVQKESKNRHRILIIDAKTKEEINNTYSDTKTLIAMLKNGNYRFLGKSVQVNSGDIE